MNAAIFFLLPSYIIPVVIETVIIGGARARKSSLATTGEDLGANCTFATHKRNVSVVF